jgi:hypothetical protein
MLNLKLRKKHVRQKNQELRIKNKGKGEKKWKIKNIKHKQKTALSGFLFDVI